MTEGNMGKTIARIYGLMRAQGMDQADIVDKGKIDKSTLSNILSGKRANPSSRSLAKIARALGTTLDYLLLKTDNPYPVNGKPMPDFGPDVVEAMRHLPRARNYELLVIARSFLEHQQEINALSMQELRDKLLDADDMLFGSDKVDDLIRRRLLPPEDEGTSGDSDSSVDTDGSESNHSESPDDDSA